MPTSSYQGTHPGWLFGSEYVQSTGRQVDWDNLPPSYKSGGVTVTCGANAAQNATTMTLTVPVNTTIATGTTLYFGAGLYARLAQPVVGTGSPVANIAVEALVNAITNGATALHGGAGPKMIKAGTIMANTANGKVIPLSLVTLAYTAAFALKGTNTGNGVFTLAGTPTLAGVKPGAYRVVFVEAAVNLGTFVVFDPNGLEIGEGKVGTAFATQIAFTIADGATDWVAGDEITVTVTETDGTSCAGLIITDATEASYTDAASGYGIVVGGVVYSNLLPEAPAGGDITAAQKAALKGCGTSFLFETYVDTRTS